jgi:tRNA1Val (adenine37-N6)-methyltransferase
MLAQRSHPTDAPIHAVEIHPPSARCAERNLAASEWAARYRVVEMSIQNFAQVADNQYDLIVSNPPFFSETTMSPDATRRVGRSMGDALPLSDLLGSVVRLLAPSGRFCVVLPVAEGRFLKEMAATRGLYWTRECAVFARAGRPAERLLLQLERDPYHVERSTLVVYEQGTIYTEAYATWMRDFLL